MVLHLDEEHVPRPVEPHLVRFVQQRLSRRSAIARVALLSLARDRGEFAALQVKPPDHVIADLAEVERTVWTDGEAIDIVHLFSGITRRSVARNGRDLLS